MACVRHTSTAESSGYESDRHEAPERGRGNRKIRTGVVPRNEFRSSDRTNRSHVLTLHLSEAYGEICRTFTLRRFVAFGVNAHRSVGVPDVRHTAAVTELAALEMYAHGAHRAGGLLAPAGAGVRGIPGRGNPG